VICVCIFNQYNTEDINYFVYFKVKWYRIIIFITTTTITILFIVNIWNLRFTINISILIIIRMITAKN